MIKSKLRFTKLPYQVGSCFDSDWGLLSLGMVSYIGTKYLSLQSMITSTNRITFFLFLASRDNELRPDKLVRKDSPC